MNAFHTDLPDWDDERLALDEQIAILEQRFGMSAAEFQRQWAAFEIPDTHEANAFAILIESRGE